MTQRRTLDEDYTRLKNTFAVLIALVLEPIEVPPEDHPIAFIESLEGTSPGKARKSLEAGVNDMLEMTYDLAATRVREVDLHMQTLGLITLSKLRQDFSRRLAAIFQRGSIRTLNEFYLIKGVRDGILDSGDDLSLFDRLIEEFDARPIATAKAKN